MHHNSIQKLSLLLSSILIILLIIKMIGRSLNRLRQYRNCDNLTRWQKLNKNGTDKYPPIHLLSYKWNSLRNCQSTDMLAFTSY